MWKDANVYYHNDFISEDPIKVKIWDALAALAVWKDKLYMGYTVEADNGKTYLYIIDEKVNVDSPLAIYSVKLNELNKLYQMFTDKCKLDDDEVTLVDIHPWPNRYSPPNKLR